MSYSPALMYAPSSCARFKTSPFGKSNSDYLTEIFRTKPGVLYKHDFDLFKSRISPGTILLMVGPALPTAACTRHARLTALGTGTLGERDIVLAGRGDSAAFESCGSHAVCAGGDRS